MLLDFFFFKQKTAYEMRISDWSSDVCSSDLVDDETLLAAIRRLPQGSGIIFRHYTLPTNERRPLFARARAIAQRRRLILLLAGPAEIALAWKADGFHGRFSRKRRHARLIHTAPAHDVPELRKAERTNADLIFILPVFPTRDRKSTRL